MAALLGMLTGIGGGMTRNLLLAKIPTVLRADLYASSQHGIARLGTYDLQARGYAKSGL